MQISKQFDGYHATLNKGRRDRWSELQVSEKFQEGEIPRPNVRGFNTMLPDPPPNHCVVRLSVRIPRLSAG